MARELSQAVGVADGPREAGLRGLSGTEPCPGFGEEQEEGF